MEVWEGPCCSKISMWEQRKAIQQPTPTALVREPPRSSPDDTHHSIYCPGHGVKLLGRLPCVLKVQVSIPARRMVPFFGAMALSLSVLLSGLCPCGASVRGRGFGHFASTKCHPV